VLKVGKGCRKRGGRQVTKAESAIWFSAFTVSRQLERCITAFWTCAKSKRSVGSCGKGRPVVISAVVGGADLPHGAAEGIANLIFEAASGTTTTRIASKNVHDDALGNAGTGTARDTSITGLRTSSPSAPVTPRGFNRLACHFLEAVFNIITHIIVVHQKLLDVTIRCRIISARIKALIDVSRSR